MTEQKNNRGSNLSAESRSKGGSNSPGNFKHDPARAAEAGRKGGQARGNRRAAATAAMQQQSSMDNQNGQHQ